MTTGHPANVALVRQAALHADYVRDALKASVNIPEIVKAWSATHPVGQTVTPQQARDWARLHIRTDVSKLAIALKQVYSVGYVIGIDHAVTAVGRVMAKKATDNQKPNPAPVGDYALLFASSGLVVWGGANRSIPKVDPALSVSFDWGKWSPGHRAAAALVKPPKGLQSLFDRNINKQIIIKGIDATTLDRIGTILARNLEEGAADTSIARDILDANLTDALGNLLDDPRRALTIANTEMNRAMSSASVDSYRELGVEQVEWQHGDDCDCVDCIGNEDAGPQPIGTEFPSGDTEPPVHPNCTCAILPFIEGDSTPLSDMGGDVVDESGDSINLAVSPDRVKGVPGPLEVARALSRLAILPNPNHPDLADQDKYVESPWAVVPLPTVDPNAWDDAVTVVVDLEDLYGTDAFLKRKNIRKHIETMGQAVTPFRSYALIAEVAGKLIIVDGHHRLMASWLLGQDSAAVYKIVIN
jgi:hypothetical protein